MNLPDEHREKIQALFTAMADVFELAMRQARDRQPSTPASQSQRPAEPAAAGGALDRDRLWDVGDVAKFLQASRSWVYKAAEAGALPCLRVGAMLRFEPEAVMRSIGLDVPAKPPRAAPRPVAHQRPPPISLGRQSVQPVGSPQAARQLAMPQLPPRPLRPPAIPTRPIEAFLSARQAAVKLGVCTATVYKLCETGELRHARISNAIKVAPEDLERLLATRINGGTRPPSTTEAPAPSQG